MFKKNGLSYAKIIKNIILTSKEKKLTLQSIYDKIVHKYPQICKKRGWQNSIRHNLSLNSSFYKIPRQGKGNYWAVKNKKNDFVEEIAVSEIDSEFKEILFTGNLTCMDEEFDIRGTNHYFKFN